MAYKKTPKVYKYNIDRNIDKKISRNFTTKIKAKKRTFSRKDYMSGDGMLTSVWGPAAWHLGQNARSGPGR